MYRRTLSLYNGKSGQTIMHILSQYDRPIKRHFPSQTSSAGPPHTGGTSGTSLFLVPQLESLAKDNESIGLSDDDASSSMNQTDEFGADAVTSLWKRTSDKLIQTLKLQISPNVTNRDNNNNVDHDPVSSSHGVAVEGSSSPEVARQNDMQRDAHPSSSILPISDGMVAPVEDSTCRQARPLPLEEDVVRNFETPFTPILIEKVRHAVQVRNTLDMAEELVSVLENILLSGPSSPTAFIADEIRRWWQKRAATTFMDGSLPNNPRAAPDLTWRAQNASCGRRASAGEGYPHSLQVEYAAGIAARLKLPASTSRQRIRAVMSHPHDAQVNEVLPNHRVVTFTEPTLPYHVLPNTELRRVLDESLRRVTVIQPSILVDMEHRSTIMTLHMVIHRDRTPWSEVALKIRETVDDVFGAGTVKEVNVNIPLGDGMMVTQTCSVSVEMRHLLLQECNNTGAQPASASTSVPATAAGEAFSNARVHLFQGVPHQDHVALLQSHGAKLYTVLSRLNLLPLPFTLQLLGWRPFSCDAALAPFCQKQYSVLLRGIQQHSQSLESTVQKASLAVPNFFPPDFFGPTDCPFRTYHVVAAMAAGRFREAVAMIYGLLLWPAVPLTSPIGSQTTEAVNTTLKDRQAFLCEPDAMVPSYAHQLLGLLQSGEDRPAHIRQALEQILPSSLWQALQQSKAALLWNVMASCQIQSWSTQRADLLHMPPAIGDFVIRTPAETQASTSGNPSPEDHRRPKQKSKEKRGSRSSASSFRCSACGYCQPGALLVPPVVAAPPRRPSFRCEFCERVQRVTCEEEASECTVFDVVLPLLPERSLGWERLSSALGFSTSTDGALPSVASAWSVTAHPSAAAFRAVLKPVSGFPHASRPWVKALSEPPAAMDTTTDRGEQAQPEAGRFALSSDRNLAASPTPHFTAPSRGPRAGLWPIGTYGHTMVDRLPAGLLAASSASSSAKGRAGTTSLKCLAIHCTLPGEVSLSNFLREFSLIHVALPPPTHLKRSPTPQSTMPPPDTTAADDNGARALVSVDEHHRTPKEEGEETPRYEHDDGNVLSIPTRGGRRRVR